MGLFHTTGASLPRRAAKYRPLVPVLREFALRPDTPLAGDVKDMIAGQLDKAGVRLAAICGDVGGGYVAGIVTVQPPRDTRQPPGQRG